MKNLWKTIRETATFVLITLAIVLPIRAFVAEPFIVNGVSMVPSFNNGEYLIIDELTYQFRQPERGEVIIFRYPLDPEKFFIKRVIGRPQETVEIENGRVFITDIAGKRQELEEPYIRGNGEPLDDFAMTLGEHEYFVMGDNRPLSLDSRSWGSVPEKLIKGRVWLRLLPFSKAELWPANYEKN